MISSYFRWGDIRLKAEDLRRGIVEDKLEMAIGKYGFQVRNRYRARGAVMLDTSDGLVLMRETGQVRSHFDFENKIKERLSAGGMKLTDRVIPNSQGELVTEWETGEKYVAYQWYAGEDCDYRDIRALTDAVKNLGRLHRNLRNVSEEPVAIEESLLERYRRHNREMKRVYGYMREKKRKSDFELSALDSFAEFYEKGLRAEERLGTSAYYAERGGKTRDICHGEYNYHNLIMTPCGVATTNFEKAAYGMQLMDLAYFFRKVMEKNGWDREKGKAVLEGYGEETDFGQEEREFLAIILGYPIKYWKLLNQYMNRKKSWISNKNTEKLKRVMEQEESKIRFLQLFEKEIGKDGKE